jgi:hypothetical protein
MSSSHEALGQNLTHSRDAGASECLARHGQKRRLPANKGGRRSADRRVVKSRATCCDVTAATRFGRGARHERCSYLHRPLRARSPLGAPPRLSSRGFRLHAIRSRPRVTPAGGPGVTRSSLTPKPSTWHPGRITEGVDTRTARERSVSLRPQEPHSLRLTGAPSRKASLRNERRALNAFAECLSTSSRGERRSH